MEFVSQIKRLWDFRNLVSIQLHSASKYSKLYSKFLLAIRITTKLLIKVGICDTIYSGYFAIPYL